MTSLQTSLVKINTISGNLSSYTSPQRPALAPISSAAKMEKVSLHLSKASSSLWVLDIFYSHPPKVFYLLVSPFFLCFTNVFLSTAHSYKHALVFPIFLTSHSIPFLLLLYFSALSQESFFKIAGYTCLCFFFHHSLLAWLQCRFSFQPSPLTTLMRVINDLFYFKFTVAFASFKLSLLFGFWDLTSSLFSSVILSAPPYPPWLVYSSLPYLQIWRVP